MTDFISWWQYLPEKMNPVAFELGPLKVQYYGLMYIVAFAVTYALVLYRLKHEDRFDITTDQLNSLTTITIIGLIIGARLGYALFYNLGYFIQHPLEIILPFTIQDGFRFTGFSGMSYHGGLIGVMIAGYLYLRRTNLTFRSAADLFIPAIPLGYTFGRLGNFINGELYGRVTASAVGMFFPMAPGLEPRHPSQLYEAFFEGIFLFAALWTAKRFIQRPKGVFLSLYLFGYGLVRFFIEYFRQPDAHLGFVFLHFSMGQVLCGLMMLGALVLYVGLLRIETKN